MSGTDPVAADGSNDRVDSAPLVDITTILAGAAAIEALGVEGAAALASRIRNLLNDLVSDESGGNQNSSTTKTSYDIIAPDGNLIGEAGNGPDVQVMTQGYNGQSGLAGAQGLFNELTNVEGAIDVTPQGYRGNMVKLPSGDIIGIRPVSGNGEPAIDVNINGKYTKFKFP